MARSEAGVNVGRAVGRWFVSAGTVLLATGIAVAQGGGRAAGGQQQQGPAGVGAPAGVRAPGGVPAALPGPLPMRTLPIDRTRTLLPPTPAPAGRPVVRPPTPAEGQSPNSMGTPSRRFDDAAGAVVGGDGFTADGVFVGDRSRLRFHVGGPFFFDRNHFHHRRVVIVPSWWWWRGLYPYGYYDDYQPGYSGAPYDPNGAAAVGAATAAPQPPARPLTVRERGEVALQQGDGREAVKEFREHLKAQPDDTAAMRLLAVALLEDKRFDEATAVMAMAYEKEPTLARTPIDGSAVGGDGDLRRLVLAAVAYANRVNTSAAWLTVASLMQAEGRDETARRMVERAGRNGLSPRVNSEFQAALRRA